MSDHLAFAALVLAALPAALATINLFFYRRLLPATGAPPPVSVLIPARNEAERIEPALRSVLASRGVDFECVVLDDHSSDDTGAIVERLAASDPRLRLAQAPALPPGWSGKQHACFQLSKLARHDVMLFMDADVRLQPDGLARMAARLTRRGVGMTSGFPRQMTETFAEKLVVPMIQVLLLGYLPMALARLTTWPAAAAACGQLIMIRRDAYVKSGGHAAIRSSLHDGVKLPRAVRAHGIATDLFDATDVAACRMYRGAREVWQGFSKNATEGMATPVALPVWTVLLFGGHVLPFLLLLGDPPPPALRHAALACACALGLRLALAVRLRQSLLGALLHPLGVVATLAIQFTALARTRRGGSATWRGRSYQNL